MKGITDRYKSIVKGSKLGTWIWNIKTGEFESNDFWSELLGYSLEEVNWTTIQEWENFTHPEDLKKVNVALDKHFTEENPIYECDFRMTHKNGDWVWILVRGSVIQRTNDRQPVLMSGIVMDITER